MGHAIGEASLEETGRPREDQALDPSRARQRQLERPEAFNAAVDEWLVETRARRGVGGRS